MARHRVTRRPQCEVCGEPDLYARRASEPPRLGARPKAPGSANDQRSATLAATYRRFRRQVGSPTGVITGLTVHHATGAPAIHAVSAGPIVALRYRGLDGLRAGLASTNAGKGTTRLRSRVSALGEALERHSGVYQGDEPRVSARMEDLDGAIHPNACMHFSDAQYDERARRNPAAGPADRIPPRFDPAVPAEWTALWSLATGRKAYLPTMLLYHDYPVAADDRTCLATSNGAASGNCLEEAVLHGLLELVERDCVAMWWYHRVRRPAVDLTGAEDRFLRRMRRAYRAIGREWWVLDLTNDLEIPCFGAVSRRMGPGPEEPLFGFGAHLDPAIALRRALTELNQVVVARDGRNTPFATDPRMARWLADASLSAHPHLEPLDGPAVVRRSLATEDVFDDLNLCVARLGATGLDPLILDQTRPDIGVPVARVVVPELRNFRARFAPGRLYSVPAKLGWVPRQRAEGDLNPVTFIL
jgi:ribosomal protein S12 methylthiotransferase accessory factor